MIERLVGRCVAKSLTPPSVVVDVQGVGYGVEMPEAAVLLLAEDQIVTLWIYTHVREDALRLFGFPTAFDRQIFLLLLTISGIGPKVAMGILSGIDAAALVTAIEAADEDALEAIPGVGAKQAKKIILELKPKLEKLRAAGLLPSVAAAASAVAAPTPRAAAAGLSPMLAKDLGSALQNFGYKEREFASLFKKWERAAPAAALPELLRLALAELAGTARAAGPERESAKPATTAEDLF